MPIKLTGVEIKKRLKHLPAWKLKEGCLHRNFKFESFVSAFSFMTATALEAEKMDHHPAWSNVYSTVEIDLQTHNAKGITELDFDLARKMERIAASFLT